MSIFSRRAEKTPLGIYVHIPFCKSKCQYCDFYSLACKDDNLMDSYLDSSTGIITMREDNIEDQQSKIQDESDQLTETYNTNYERYLEEYTNTLIETYTMKVSMAAFM